VFSVTEEEPGAPNGWIKDEAAALLLLRLPLAIFQYYQSGQERERDTLSSYFLR
jgi:hypothetical protein